eukprot:gnl/TRDRNA2_/TRDRNA2_65472_c0_seq2.p1 gnl/TRDRNA2_/TRDRNA2_65472_c0~~gnl/TRDRNA2_/TRDRNA2_65472_c0_seq2.p1  ORF type:complete len:934 (+),score=226.75 gnl/TRDRNA2_/TRDRNA2_65472_c0_seq2:98-2803(+)
MADNGEDEGAGGEEKKKKKKRPEAPLARDSVIKRLKNRQEQARPSPMVELQEIFAESPDTSRFLGDVMFWKYFEDINVPRIYHTNSVEYINLKLMFYETIFYVFMLFMLTLLIFALQRSEVYDARVEQLNYWSGCDTLGICKLNDVTDVDSFWHWMQNEMVENAFTHYENEQKVVDLLTQFPQNDFPLTFNPRFVGEQQMNVLLGSVRVRQLRAKTNEGCKVSKLFSHVFHECWGDFNPRSESMEDFSQRFIPTYLAPAYQYRTPMQTQQIMLEGKTAYYPGGGFMFDMPLNKTESKIMFQDLWEWYWVDRATRAVIIEFTTLNTNVNVIVNSRIAFEFLPTGSVIATHNADAQLALMFTPSMKAGAPLGIFLLQLVVLITFFLFTVYVFSLMVKTMLNYLGQNLYQFMKHNSIVSMPKHFMKTCFHFFMFGWNFVDVLILGLFYVYLGFRIRTYMATGNEPNFQAGVIGHPEKFMPFSTIMWYLDNCGKVFSILALVCWVKMFKYLCLVSYFRLLVRILERCAKSLVIFSVLLLVIFFGFAVAFFIGFGDKVVYFSYLSNSFLVLFFLLLDGYNVDSQWFAPGVMLWTPMVFLIFCILVYFVLLNVFIGIVLDVYAIASHALSLKESGVEKKNPMFVFMITYYQWLKGMTMVVEEQENLSSEDRQIELRLLPGIVRWKWIEKKRKMQKVANDFFAGLELFPVSAAEMERTGKTQRNEWSLPHTQSKFHQMHNSDGKPPPIYRIPDMMLDQFVSKSQLQRLMDEDEALPLLLNTKRAIDVIRRYKGTDAGEDGDIHAAEFQQLQQNILAKLEERVDPEQDLPKIPEIKEMTDEMSTLLNDVRYQFRVQLAGLIEATAVLSEHLIGLTQSIEAVRNNHESVLDMVAEQEGSTTYGESSYGMS